MKITKALWSIACMGVLFFQGFGLSAQDEGVTWKTSVKHMEGDLYEIVFKATIRPGYHLYDLGPYEDEYINVTEFEFDPSQSVIPEGKPYHITKPVKKFDEVFGLEIGYFYNTAEFGQKVRLKGREGTLTGLVIWAICDDTSCLPPSDTEFEVKIKSK